MSCELSTCAVYVLCQSLSFVVYIQPQIVDDRSMTVETTLSLVPEVRRSSCPRPEHKNILKK